uniref:CSON013349 protein n=1 Tax=Culicoides sonorensis TaxID=179676 RepID=A0A336MC25_CULSO
MNKILNSNRSRMTKFELENNSYLFQYGPAIGRIDFRKVLADFLSRKYHATVDPYSLVITTGATQGLHLILSTLLDMHAFIFVDEVTYMIALEAISQFSTMKIVTVPFSTKTGVNLDDLEKLISERKFTASKDKQFWGVYYTIPTYHNPTGVLYSEETNKKLVELAREYNFLIACDDVYNVLCYDSKIPPKRLFAYDSVSDSGYQGNVISNGTFSKILSPGIRLGWMECPLKHVNIFKESGILKSGGCANGYMTGIVQSLIELKLLDDHLDLYYGKYKKRMEIACKILKEHLDGECGFHAPTGGYFIWITFPEGTNCLDFNDFCRKKKRQCQECRRMFCMNCLAKKNEKFYCEKCLVLTARPISRPDLQKLKPKDLIYYLQSKHISTAGCVEKEELITLVVAYANNTTSNSPQSNSTTGSPQNPNGPENPFDQIRQTCTTLFTNITEKIATDLQKSPFAYGYAHPAPAPPPAPVHSSTSSRPNNNNVQSNQNVSSSANANNAPSPGTSTASRPVMTQPLNLNDPSTDTSSSFEEIGAVGGHSPDDWQFIVTKSTKDKEKLTKIKHSIDQIDKVLGEKRPNQTAKRISRRRSDSDVNTIDDIRDCLFDEEIKRSRKSCDKCNEAGEKIRKRISEFRQQLELPSVTEDENREILDNFLKYLESSSKVSVPHTPEEMVKCVELRAASESHTQTETIDNNEPQPSSSTDSTENPPQSPLERIPFDPNQRVNLTDINSRADFDLLTVKQLKEILALNRVDFKGCCEKKELKERVIRLWTNHTALPKPDDLPPDDLCKICMDAPIECVLLECGHLVACVKCSKVLSECPICRAYIVRIVRFFRV